MTPDDLKSRFRQQAQGALAAAAGFANRLAFAVGDIHDFKMGERADLISMNRALHHVWEKGQAGLFHWLRDNLKSGGYAVVWEPAWPEERGALREPSRRTMAFQNLTEHVQGNHRGVRAGRHESAGVFVRERQRGGRRRQALCVAAICAARRAACQRTAPKTFFNSALACPIGSLRIARSSCPMTRNNPSSVLCVTYASILAWSGFKSPSDSPLAAIAS